MVEIICGSPAVWAAEVFVAVLSFGVIATGTLVGFGPVTLTASVIPLPARGWVCTPCHVGRHLECNSSACTCCG
jgi:hypothetical protein